MGKARGLKPRVAPRLGGRVMGLKPFTHNRKKKGSTVKKEKIDGKFIETYIHHPAWHQLPLSWGFLHYTLPDLNDGWFTRYFVKDIARALCFLFLAAGIVFCSTRSAVVEECIKAMQADGPSFPIYQARIMVGLFVLIFLIGLWVGSFAGELIYQTILSEIRARRSYKETVAAIDGILTEIFVHSRSDYSAAQREAQDMANVLVRGLKMFQRPDGTFDEKNPDVIKLRRKLKAYVEKAGLVVDISYENLGWD